MQKSHKSFSSFCKENKIPKSSAHRRCKDLGIDTSSGLSELDQARLLLEFKDTQPPGGTGETPGGTEEPIASSAIVEVGNHQVILEGPDFPQTYSLEPLRNSESITLENPLEVAAQFLQAADLIQAAMNQDIQNREQGLGEVRDAKKAVADKAQELELSAKLYALETKLINNAQSQETTDLQALLTKLQAMGKPPEGKSSAS
jgi:hypothetical protein